MSDVISQTVNIEIRERLADGTYKLKNPKTTADMVIDSASKVLMLPSERTKLNGVATGANNYNHPATHPYSIIFNPPTIPTLTSQLTNNSGFLTLKSSVTGSYIGNGSTTRTILIGFTPTGIYVNKAIVPSANDVDEGLATTGNNVMGGDSVIAVGIVSGGFSVGYKDTVAPGNIRTNTNNIVYTYVAFR